jgi:hypothetical protein
MDRTREEERFLNQISAGISLFRQKYFDLLLPFQSRLRELTGTQNKYTADSWLSGLVGKYIFLDNPQK